MEDPSNGTVGTRLKRDNGVALELETMQTSRDSVEENGFHVIGDEIEVRVTQYAVGNSSAAGAVVNYVNTIVGAAIVGLPFALAQVLGLHQLWNLITVLTIAATVPSLDFSASSRSNEQLDSLDVPAGVTQEEGHTRFLIHLPSASGLWAGIIMMCVAASLNGWSTHILIAAGEKMGKLNYEELMGELYGTVGLHSFCFFAGILAFGAMSAYLIILGDTIPKVLLAANVTAGPFTDRATVIAFFGILFVLPVSLLKDMSKLAYTSLISVCAVGLLTCIIVFTGPGVTSPNVEVDRSELLTFVRPTLFAGFGAMSFAFVCQQSSFLVYRSMREGGVRRWAGVTRWSLSIAWAMSLVISVAGYLIFGTETEGNVLNSFPTDDLPASVARGLLAVTMIFSYPIEMYVARHVFDVSVFQTSLGMGPITSKRHYAITLAIWALTMTVACSTDDLGFILDIFGALSSTVIGYILPALMHIRCNREDMRRAKAAWNRGAPEYDSSFCGRLWALRHFYFPVFVAVFGVIALVAGVATSIWFEVTTLTTSGTV